MRNKIHGEIDLLHDNFWASVCILCLGKMHRVRKVDVSFCVCNFLRVTEQDVTVPLVCNLRMQSRLLNLHFDYSPFL